jgi:hypothetical protein
MPKNGTGLDRIHAGFFVKIIITISKMFLKQYKYLTQINKNYVHRIVREVFKNEKVIQNSFMYYFGRLHYCCCPCGMCSDRGAKSAGSQWRQ